jgi:hypothetical protein
MATLSPVVTDTHGNIKTTCCQCGGTFVFSEGKPAGDCSAKCPACDTEHVVFQVVGLSVPRAGAVPAMQRICGTLRGQIEMLFLPVPTEREKVSE